VALAPRTKSVIRLAAGLALFVGLLWYLIPSWAGLVAQVDIVASAFAVGLLGAAVAHIAVAARWKLLTEATGGNRLSLWAYLHSLLVTRFLGQFVSSLAMDLVGRGVALRSVGSKRGVGHTATLVVLERIFDLVVPAGLVVWALLVRRPALAAYDVTLLVAGTALFVALAVPGLTPLARLALAVYGRFKRDDVGELPVGITFSISFQVALLSVVRFAAVLVQFAGIGVGIGMMLPWADWVAATPVAQLTALVGVTPGGLGVVEVGWWAGLSWVGVDRSTIGLYLIAQRTALIAFLGTLALATWPFARRPAAGVPEAT
jgi:uncharacterized membrane protein YbhN (UPF0104 family)